MKNSRLKQTLHYQLNYFGWSSLYVYGISVLIMIAIGLGVTHSLDIENSNIVGGLGGVGFVHLLILGIGGIRGDLKFFLQHGISRRTTFFSHLYGSLICAVILGLFCEVFNIVSNRWLNFSESIYVFSTPGFFTGWFTYIITFFFAWQIGALISLIYYRLSKMQQIVFSVIAIALIVLTFSSGIRYIVGFPDDFGNLIQRIVENPIRGLSPWLLGTLLLSIIAALGNFLLLRRAPVKE